MSKILDSIWFTVLLIAWDLFLISKMDFNHLDVLDYFIIVITAILVVMLGFKIKEKLNG